MTNDKVFGIGAPSGYLQVLVTQDNITGLSALIHWLAGFEAAGKGRPPGQFELVMHYRALQDAAAKHNATLIPAEAREPSAPK